jgi:aryl-alcohol dehydrogenase-like predicted oxidoreductase
MPSDPKLSRRDFLGRSGLVLGAAAALPALPPAGPAAGAKLPHRTLGRTGASVSILAFGCGSRFLMYEPADAGLAILNRAIDLGINYLDTAIDYGDGQSETRVGMVMKARRKEVFLATKIPGRARTRDAALREFESSLKRLQTDHVDLLHLHSLGDEADLAKIEAPAGALKALYELREQKAARFIGMTSHTDGAVMAKAIERHDLDCVQMAMNPARANRFEEMALPAANKRDLGVILMKVTAQERLLGEGKADAASLLRYAWSLPVSSVVCGMPKPEFVEANVACARAFAPMPPGEMDRLRTQYAGARVALERFFAHHQDGHAA